MATKKSDSGVDPMDSESPTREAIVAASADPSRISYADNPDKPHETSIAQIQIVEEP